MTPAVLVVFSSRTGTTEKLALASGVGAVQARARIRLRRLAEDERSDPGESAGAEEARMSREYVSPTEADLEWADALALCPSFPPGDSTPGLEWREFFAVLSRMGRAGRLDGKIAAVVAGLSGQDLSDSSRAQNGLGAALLSGLVVLPPAPAGEDPVVAAGVQGRRLAMVVRALDGKPASWRDAIGLL